MTTLSSSESCKSDSPQSIYLLGNAQMPPLLKRYRLLREAFVGRGEFLSADEEPEWLACYDRDSQHMHTLLPLLVFRPYTTGDIAPFIQACSQENIPVRVRCGGTSLTGASVAPPEGVLVLTGHFKSILHYQSQDGKATIEPGVTPDELNALAEAGGWWLPLEMATSGAAGLAGCLSCHAKGYHQRGRPLFQCIRSVTIVDGKGEVLDVPFQLMCGTEGIFGIVIRLELQLMRRPEKRLQAVCQLPWKSLFIQLPVLQHYQALVGLSWQNNRFTFHLEGEEWRVAPALDYIIKQCEAAVVDSPFRPFYPQTSAKQFILISSACKPTALPKGIEFAEECTKELELRLLVWADVWSGAIHLQLCSDKDLYDFNRSIAHFLLLWIEWLESVEGFLISAHGIGKLLRPYLPPFIKEEEIRFLRHLQMAFDPFQLFAKDHFFPEIGKSIEQRVMRSE
ncbi:FAD-binding oxidoreductase [Candidatus Protochlamydia naegleriophila]|nr:FAD-binding oxidoreductase [Candidatus Protochlamydia naegleriophila]